MGYLHERARIQWVGIQGRCGRSPRIFLKPAAGHYP